MYYHDAKLPQLFDTTAINIPVIITIFTDSLHHILNILDEFCRNACHHGISFNILSYYTTSPYHSIVADMYARKDSCSRTYPYIPANHYAFINQNHFVLQVVSMVSNDNVRSNHRAVTYRDTANGHTCETMIDKNALSYLHLIGKVNMKWN